MLEKDILGLWLKDERERRGLHQSDLVDALNATTSSVSGYETRGLSYKKLSEICDTLKWTLPPRLEILEKYRELLESDDDENTITISSLEPVAGYGLQNLASETLRKVQVSSDWMNSIHNYNGQKKNLALCQIAGDSMFPTLRDGQTLIIDTSRKVFEVDGIYVFTYQGTLYVKRVQLLPGRRYLAISDNKEHYTAFEILPSMEEDLAVHAKVVGKYSFDKL